MARICARSAIHSITACSLRVNDRVNEFIVFETGERLNARPPIAVYAPSLTLSCSSRKFYWPPKSDGGTDHHRGKSARNVSRNNDPWKFNFPFPSWKHGPREFGRISIVADSPPPNFRLHSPRRRRKRDRSSFEIIDFDSINFSIYVYTLFF